MHRTRWITALIALPVVVVLVVRGGIAFSALLGAAALLALVEYNRIVYPPRGFSAHGAMPLLGYAAGIAIIFGASRYGAAAVAAILGINLALGALAGLPRYGKDNRVFEPLFIQVLGLVYIPLGLAGIDRIRSGPDGIAWVFLLLAVIFSGDIGAYYVGSFLGRHKLSPSVSPGKTIEGALGGLAANLLVGAAFKFLLLPAVPWAPSLAFFLLAGTAGQIGDLFESALKRSAKIKDSGWMLPGHGGILDRIDALLFASPVAYLFKVFIYNT